MGDELLSACASNVGSEATVWSVLGVKDMRRLLLCKCNSGELCEECPRKG